MSRLVANVRDFNGKVTATIQWCYDYPMHIGRHIEECIGVYSLTSAAR